MDDDPPTTLHANVSGRVQGVGYRAFVAREATALGLAGDVRNLPDGTVAVRAFGRRADLDLLVERLRRGPLFASVRAVDVRTGEPAPDLPADFRVVRRS